eukprot:1158706-Pelagomonas_calceolata.AAC.2
MQTLLEQQGLRAHTHVHTSASVLARQGLGPLTSVVRGDFTQMPFEAKSFDGAYAIEATCHAPKHVSIDLHPTQAAFLLVLALEPLSYLLRRH